jgi:hypothetical protein
MWLPVNRDPISMDIDVPSDPKPWFANYPWTARR